MAEGKVRADGRYAQVFGRVTHLSEEIGWPIGLHNMLEWLTWETKIVLGVSKSDYRKQAIKWALAELEINASDEAALMKRVAHRFTSAQRRTDLGDPYQAPGSGLASPREALRRAVYHSEDYLNKEFDILWALASHEYISAYYRAAVGVETSGRWSTHGNGGLFANSVAEAAMQIDNLAYSDEDRVLVANELKLGGKKNKDQILKYALMFNVLTGAETGRVFVDPQCRFHLLFLGDTPGPIDSAGLLDAEVAWCRKQKTNKKDHLLTPQVLSRARSISIRQTSWAEMLAFNARYLEDLDAAKAVERKLIAGFNETLRNKAAVCRRPPSSSLRNRYQGGGA